MLFQKACSAKNSPSRLLRSQSQELSKSSQPKGSLLKTSNSFRRKFSKISLLNKSPRKNLNRPSLKLERREDQEDHEDQEDQKDQKNQEKNM